MFSTEVPLAVKIDLLYLHVFELKRNVFKNSVAVVNGLFFSQLMNSHFDFLTVVESSISQVLL